MISFNIPAHETPEQAQQRMQAAQYQLATHMPTDVGSGIQSVANALMARQRQRSAAFPQAPDGAQQPSFTTRVGNMFGLGMFGAGGGFR
ncbi:hypothetical protein C8J35_103527 [Rhizobium sp. PP-F2F-G38]|nr:hypothetical protein C8J35_103527 [Rhizobium sp. PP-F2F-G38]